MQRSASLSLLVLVSAWGCSSSKPTLVYVDLSQVPSESAPVASLAFSSKSQSPGSYRIAARPGISLLVGLSESRLMAALEESRENRKVLIARILEQRLEETNRLFEARLRSEIRELEQDQWKELADSLEQTRVPFDKVAGHLGRLQIELSSLIGFPDQGNPTLPDAEWAKRRLARAEEIRAEMAALEAQYLRERNAILLAIAEDYLDRASTVQRENSRDVQAARQRILQEFRETNEPVAVPQSDVMTQIQIETENESETQVEWGGAPAGQTVIPGGQGPRFNAVSKQEWAEMWASIREYTLVSSPASGENRTKEFIQWLKNQKLIPSQR